MEKKWIDCFFKTGELMLSSFSQFRKHPDEQRRDPHEGASILDMSFGGQPLSGIAYFGSDAYILSTSMIESNELMRQFPGYDDYFRIGDPLGFASAIAEAIPNFTLGFQGPCLYQSERLVRREIQGPPLLDPSASQEFPQENAERLFDAMNHRVFEATKLEPFFFKPLEYAHQAEYRLVWCVSREKEDRSVVKCPDARRFCRRPI
jgi:hypothetical protein